MKIVHISGGGDKGGAKTHIFTLCSKLAEKHDLTLFSMREGEFADEAKKIGIKTEVFSSFALFDMVKAALRIRKIKPDAVHCHGAKANLTGIVTKLFCPKIPIITTVHSDYRLDYMHSPVKRATFGLLNSIALRFFDFHVAVSDNFKRMLIERGFKADRIMTIYNGLDFSVKKPQFDRGEYLRSLGLDFDGSQCVLGIAARLTPVKDIPTLLKAFSAAYKQNEKLRLLIGGDGDSTEELKKMSKDLGIDSAVCFCGWVKDINRFFAACDIDVLCSISESFPYSILEGIRADCAVISSDVGGVTDMIKSGENGFVFRSGDVDTFARYIVELSKDRQLITDFAQRLKATAESLYSSENMAKRQAEIYEQAVMLKKRKGRQGVLICGAYGMGNSGDEAILTAIIGDMRSIDPLMPITVMSRSPKKAAVTHFTRAVSTFNIPALIPQMLKRKLFISGGGTLIQNVTSNRSLVFYLFAIVLAKIFGQKVMLYGCGIGEIKGSFPRKLASVIINNCADVITVRDDGSKEELDSLKITKKSYTLTADPAVHLKKAEEARTDRFMESQGLDPSGKYMCFSIRESGKFKNYSVYSDAAKYAYEKYGLTAVFLPMRKPHDQVVCVKITEKMDTPYVIVDTPDDVSLTIGLLSRMKLLCAVRLHALIFAFCAGTPFAAVSYDIKVESFARLVGVSDMCVSLSSLSSDWLKDKIDSVLTGESPDFSAIKAQLQKKEKLNRDMAKKLLES